MELKKQLPFVILFVGSTFALVVFSYSQQIMLVDSLSVPPVSAAQLPVQTQVNTSFPTRLIIPAINVGATIDPVGMVADGAMDTPKNLNDVGWFNRGPRPGEKGSSVIDGHYGWKNNLPAVFNNLHTLQKGDQIYIEDNQRKMVTFVVREIRSYNPEADVSDVFSSNDEKVHLNLITCEGVWDKATKSFSKRTVVFADRE